MPTRHALLALSVLVLLAACGGDDADDGTPIASATEAIESVDDDTTDEVASEVTIARSVFEPGTVTVPAGSTVRFVNTDPFAHTVTARDGSFDSGELVRDGVFEITVDGTIEYYCLIHPTMRATITTG